MSRHSRKYCGQPCYRAAKVAVSGALAAAGEKRCSKCEAVLPLTEFSAQRPAHRFPSQRVHGWCKKCRCDDEKGRRRNPRLVAIHKSRYEGDADFRARERITAMRKACRRKGIEFNLDEAWLAEKFRGSCELTGLPFDMTVKRKWAGPYAPSIDRIKAGGGYTKANCRVVLFALNAAMNDWSLEAFLPIAEALVRRHSKSEAA